MTIRKQLEADIGLGRWRTIMNSYSLQSFLRAGGQGPKVTDWAVLISPQSKHSRSVDDWKAAYHNSKAKCKKHWKAVPKSTQLDTTITWFMQDPAGAVLQQKWSDSTFNRVEVRKDGRESGDNQISGHVREDSSARRQRRDTDNQNARLYQNLADCIVHIKYYYSFFYMVTISLSPQFLCQRLMW